MRRRDARGKDCQIVGGKGIETVVVKAFLEVTQPSGIDAAILAEDQMQRQQEMIEQSWRLQVEKAEYEVQRAERQFNASEPENRLVARELERRWNDRLRELENVRAQAKAAVEKQHPITANETERARQLGSDLATVWHAETTTHRDRKRLLRCLIEEVQLRKETKRVLVRIVWKGGAITDHDTARRMQGEWNVTPEEIVDLVRKLAIEFDDTQIARVLNKQGRRSGPGNPFTKANVGHLRRQHGIRACERKRARDPREGPFTADEAAAELDVLPSTIHRWLRNGILPGTQVMQGAPWQIVLTDELRRRLTQGAAPEGWVGLTEAAKRLGLSKSLVAYLVKRGKIPAVRATVGKRTCWRIDVSSADCGRQRGLFDQMITDKSKEA
jgi:excisionase family DNA binding protein